MKMQHILLVEDDLDDIELFKEALEVTGKPHEIRVITAGDEVLPYLEKTDRLPDIIILDLNLPKRPGKEILALLKSSDRLKQIPVVILTTSNAKADHDDCIRGGAKKFITKPVNSEGFKLMAAGIFDVGPDPV